MEIDPRTSFHTAKIKPSIARKTSSCETKLHLDVDLRELGLAVDAQILVAEALDDLEVAVEARDHVELLEELRALGERVKFPGVAAARAPEVARAARRVLTMIRGLQLEEPLLVEVAARRL